MTGNAIFDLDGTLIDTPKAIVKMMNDVLKDTEREPVSEARIRATIGLPLEQGVASLLGLPVDHTDVKAFIVRYKALFHGWLVPQASELVFTNVAQGLAALRESGIGLGVATSKHRASAEAILRSADLWQLFDFVAGADSVKQPKPHPEMAQLVADQLGGSADNCIVVGDTVHDLHMAQAAGMRTIAVTYGVDSELSLRNSGCTWIAPDFSDVVDILSDNLIGAANSTLAEQETSM